MLWHLKCKFKVFLNTHSSQTEKESLTSCMNSLRNEQYLSLSVFEFLNLISQSIYYIYNVFSQSRPVCICRYCIRTRYEKWLWKCVHPFIIGCIKTNWNRILGDGIAYRLIDVFSDETTSHGKYSLMGSSLLTKKKFCFLFEVQIRVNKNWFPKTRSQYIHNLGSLCQLGDALCTDSHTKLSFATPWCILLYIILAIKLKIGVWVAWH